MKYVIRLTLSRPRKYIYYKGVYARNATPKLSQASIFTSADRAMNIVDTIGKAWFPKVKEITDKELFKARLEGI